MSEIKIRTTTKILSDAIIVQTIESVMDEHVELISRQVANTRDEQVRQALISIGWTPPKEHDGESPC